MSRTAIEMAREAGICTWLKPPEDVTERLKRFAELVLADERARMAEQPAQQKPVAWFKHGPYEDGEPLSVVFEDPNDDVCYSPLGLINNTSPQPAQDVPETNFGNTTLDKMAENARELGLDYEPVGEAYLCDKCQTPFDGAWECPNCGHRSATKESVYTTPPAAQRQWVEVEQVKWDGEKFIAKRKEKNNG